VRAAADAAAPIFFELLLMLLLRLR
jgi:hypothetical protein